MTRRHSAATRDAGLDLVELVLIDGDNLLHAIRGGRDAGGVAWLLPRLAGWRPDAVRIVVALDGPADRSLGDRRPIAPGISVRHSGTRSADDVLVSMVEARPYAERSRTVVVTDDGRLRERVRRAGALARPIDWLARRIAGVATHGPPTAATGTAIARGRPVPRGSADGDGGAAGRAPGRAAAAPGVPEEGLDAPPRAWRPGRGATRKTGNPRRSPRRHRRPGGADAR